MAEQAPKRTIREQLASASERARSLPKRGRPTWTHESTTEKVAVTDWHCICGSGDDGEWHSLMCVASNTPDEEWRPSSG